MLLDFCRLHAEKRLGFASDPDFPCLRQTHRATESARVFDVDVVTRLQDEFVECVTLCSSMSRRRAVPPRGLPRNMLQTVSFAYSSRVPVELPQRDRSQRILTSLALELWEQSETAVLPLVRSKDEASLGRKSF